MHVPELVVFTGPIAAGKNSAADALATRLVSRGETVAFADVDDVAAMMRGSSATRARLWLEVHEAHGALVGQWMRSSVDYVVAVGPIYSAEEQASLTRTLPSESAVLRVVIVAPVAVTFARARDDASRGASRDREFHYTAHRRFRDLLPRIPADLTFDSSKHRPAEIAAATHVEMSARFRDRGA